MQVHFVDTIANSSRTTKSSKRKFNGNKLLDYYIVDNPSKLSNKKYITPSDSMSHGVSLKCNVSVKAYSILAQLKESSPTRSVSIHEQKPEMNAKDLIEKYQPLANPNSNTYTNKEMSDPNRLLNANDQLKKAIDTLNQFSKCYASISYSHIN